MTAVTTPQVKKQSTLRRVLSYVGRYPLSMVGVLFFSVLTVAATLCVPVFFGNGVDCIVKKGAVDWHGLKICFIEVGIAAAVAAISQWLLSLCNNRISCNVVRDIRKDAFDKIGKLPLQYIDTHPHGDTVSRIVADADQFSDGLLIGFTQFFTGVMTILGTVAFMLLTNWKIGLVVVIASPASLLVAKFVTSHTHKFFVAQTVTRGEQTAFVEEAIGGLKTTQAFAHEDENEEKFNEINARLEKSSMNAIFYSSLTNPSTRFINNLVYALVAMLGGFAVMGGGFAVGGFTVGGLTKFLSYANQYTKPFNEITGVIAELKSAFTSAARIFELMDEEEEISDADSAVLGAGENVLGNVRLQNVAFSYDKSGKLIEGLSLDVKQGQRIAIVGRTGSGKTTLINLLMRFYDVDGGQVCVDGEDVREVTRRSLRESYGMVLQETWLKSATVRENLKLGNPNASDEEMIAAAKAAHAHSFIKRMEKGYDTVLGEGGGLSEGQKQLLCIARIMLVKPPILLLDEATSSIDTRTELKISDGFKKLTEGRTSFVVAHRLSTIIHSDCILVMKAGRVVEQGTHDELLALGGEYAALYNGQFQ
ncbi:MAG: ABC transporter ATP-binding protein [Clostridiales bacterium]|nr:ABC transporter ATP-binding protein [Clostridiales bacterium]